MKKLILLAISLCLSLSALGQEKLNVVTTTPDFAVIAREIGGDNVEVKTLAKPTEDPHFVDAKPSLIVTLNRADVLIEGGAELELGWLPALLESTRNVKINAGAPGRIDASLGITMLEKPTTFDRSQGDVHSKGNPHFMLDPRNAKIVAAQIADRFAQIDSKSADTFKANHQKFAATLDAKLAEWLRQLEPFKGAKVVTYHKDFTYLAKLFELEVVETLEPKPGIPPSPAHVARVIEKMKTSGAKVVLIQPFQSHKTAEKVAQPTGAKVLVFPQQPGVVKNTETYVGLMDYLTKTLTEALRK